MWDDLVTPSSDMFHHLLPVLHSLKKVIQPGTTCINSLRIGPVIWDQFISYVKVKLILWGHVIRQKIPGQRRHPQGLSVHRPWLATKMAPHSEASEIYSSHLLFLQTVTAEWVSRESDVHKSGHVLESIMGTVHSGSWNSNSQEHQSESNRSWWNDEAECEF